ncbi:hypothetical protein ACWEJ6_51290 [Nonomuraea sp. NPDC004702]
MREQGQIFRESWIDDVKEHFPANRSRLHHGWEETPPWQRRTAANTFAIVREFIEDTGQRGITKLSREQRGRFVALCWIGQIYAAFDDPKPSYVPDWEDLPEWQRETDSDIFDRTPQTGVLRRPLEGRPCAGALSCPMHPWQAPSFRRYPAASALRLEE